MVDSSFTAKQKCSTNPAETMSTVTKTQSRAIRLVSISNWFGLGHKSPREPNPPIGWVKGRLKMEVLLCITVLV